MACPRWLQHYYKKWGIHINKGKSNAICFRNASGKGREGAVRESKDLTLTIEGHNINFKNQIKYLGVKFNNLFKFNDHARCNKTKANKATKIFMPFLKHNALGKKAKLLF